jgi:hypothetical protein
MGILTSHERSNYETLASETVSYTVGDSEYHLKFELREYDRYERFIVFRDETRRRQVRVQAYDGKPSKSQYIGHGISVGSSVVAEQKSTWDAESDADPSGGFEYQLTVATQCVLDELREHDDLVSDFADNIPRTMLSPDRESDDGHEYEVGDEITVEGEQWEITYFWGMPFFSKVNNNE